MEKETPLTRGSGRRYQLDRLIPAWQGNCLTAPMLLAQILLKNFFYYQRLVGIGCEVVSSCNMLKA